MAGLSDRAMIAKLNIHLISFSESDKRTTARVHNELLKESRESGRWLKIKFNREDIGELMVPVDKARAYHQEVTRPFGDDGGRLLPLTLVFEYAKKMGALKRDFEAERDKMIGTDKELGTWAAIIERQRERLGPEFNAATYPSVEKLEKTFRFVWNLLPVPDWAQIHDKDHVLFKIEEDVAKEITSQAREYERRMLSDSMGGLWMRALTTVDRMKKAGLESDRIHASLIEKLESESKLLKELNFTDDPEINTISDEIRDKLCGYSVKQIRKDPALKRRLGLAAEAISDKIKVRVFLDIPLPAMQAAA
jgi:hypothetical protein